MRIALLTPGFSRFPREWSLPFLDHFVRSLAEKHDVQVFALRYPGQGDTYPFYRATVHSLRGISTQSGISRLPLWHETIECVTRVHRQKPFDVIHAIWADETGLLAGILGKRLNVPVITTIAGGELAAIPSIGYGLQLGRFSRWMVRIALRLADCVIAPSQYTAAMVSMAGVSPERLAIVPFGVHTGMFTPTDLPPRPPQRRRSEVPHLIAAGSYIPVKNHLRLLEIFAHIQTPGVTLRIAGSGNGALREHLIARSAALGIADRVILKGAIHTRMPELYRAAHLHLLTSYHEGFGLVVTESAACGIPTLGFPVGVISELAAETLGFTVSPDWSNKDIAIRIDQLLSDPAELDAAGIRAMNWVRENGSVKNMVDAVTCVYTQVMR